MLVERNGFLDFEYKGKLLHIKFSYWELKGAAYFNIYDRNGNEYRYSNPSLRGKKWVIVRGVPTWTKEFDIVLKDQLEKQHQEVQARYKD